MTDIIIIDLETTGLNNDTKFDQPVEIAITDMDGAELFHSYVMPTVDIDPSAAGVTQIDRAFLETVGAPTFEAVYDRLHAVLEAADTIYAWNAGYDLRVLDNAVLEAFGSQFIRSLKWQDAMRPYGERFGRKRADTGEYVWASLGSAFEHQFGHAAYDRLADAHSALFDCRLTADLIAIPDAGIKTFESGFFRVTLVGAKAMKTAYDKPYIAFKTVGDIKVNVFLQKYAMFNVAGWPLDRLTDILNQPDQRGAWYTLKNPIYATIQYTNDFPEICTVFTKGQTPT